MKILELGRFDFQNHKGGVQFYADSLARHLSREIAVDLLVSSNSLRTKITEEGNLRKISVATYGEFQSVPFSPTLIWWFYKLLRKNDYDIIHLNFPDPLAMLAAFFIPRNIPIVVTWHSDIVRQKWALRFYSPILQKFMRRVRRILVSTPYHLNSCPQLKALGMDERVVVIPFGIEQKDWELTPAVEARAREIRAQYDGNFVIFALGRHVYYKGYEYLLGAMAQLPGCHLILGGSGPLTPYLKEMCARAKIEHRVTFAGYIPDSELSAYIYASDLFCFPSVDTSETFGYAQVEAMMCGRAVLSGDLKNGVNFVNLHRETGIVVPIRNADKIAEAVKLLKTRPDLLEMLSKNARARALSEFTAEMTALRTLQIFRELSR